jgi:hypothetical protein
MFGQIWMLSLLLLFKSASSTGFAERNNAVFYYGFNWRQKNLGVFDGKFQSSVAPYGILLLRLTAAAYLNGRK